jgi:hypothetical protein
MQTMTPDTHSGPAVATGLLALLMACLLGLAVVPAHAWDLLGNKTIVGSGHASSVKRELASYHQIAVDLPCKVELVQGTSEAVEIAADDNLLPLIETVVKNGQLTIKPAKGVNLSSRTSIQLTVYARSVDALSLAGSADLLAARLQSPKLSGSIAGSGSMTIKDLQSDALSVSIAGSGRFEAQGAAAVMDVSIAGSGDVNAPRLSAQDVNVNIAGSGDATVWARKALSVSIVGSGNVRYYGDATRADTSTLGSGRVRQLGSSPPV